MLDFNPPSNIYPKINNEAKIEIESEFKLDKLFGTIVANAWFSIYFTTVRKF